MKTVVFYSYKGGTGRTLALANVATLAAAVGKRVVVIDMDLEAPGTTYKLLGADYGQASSCRGLVGYLLDMIESGERPDPSGYLVPVPIVAELGVETDGGELLLIPAGRVPSAGYFGELRRLNFDARAADGSAVGYMRGVLEQIEASLAPELVLIDARTGITNSNSLALSELADEVYAFYLDLPEQRDGTRMVLRSLAPLARAGHPTLTAVLSRVPAESEHSQAGWTQTAGDRERLESTIAFLEQPTTPTEFTLESVTALQLHHHPNLVVSEELVLPRLAKPGVALYPLAWDYARLARQILGDDPLLAKVTKRLKKHQPHLAAVLADDPDLRALGTRAAAELKPAGEEPLTARIATYRAAAQHDPAAVPTLASLLVSLSQAEREVGRRQEALDAANEAATLHRDLAVRGGTTVSPNLAAALNNLSNRLSDSGDRTGALAAIEEAVYLYRALAETNPAESTPDLAMSLNNLSTCRSETGDRAGALQAIEEAVNLYRGLVATNPAAFTPDLANSLHNLSNQLSETGDRTGALAAIEEAVYLYRALAETNPAESTPDLAMSLNNLSTCRSETGDRAGALQAIEEAVNLYRGLVATSPAAFTPDLAASLHNLSNQLSETGDRVGALEAIQEAVDLRRELARANPAAFTPDLAASLHNLSIWRSGVGDRVGALEAIQEAVDLRRELARANPAAFAPDLAASLNNLSLRLQETGDRVGALEAAEEARTLYRSLVDT